MSATVTPGDKRRTGRGHVDSYGDDRVCEAVACRTVLSRYNDRAWCWKHSAANTPRHLR